VDKGPTVAPVGPVLASQKVRTTLDGFTACAESPGLPPYLRRRPSVYYSHVATLTCPLGPLVTATPLSEGAPRTVLPAHCWARKSRRPRYSLRRLNSMASLALPLARASASAELEGGPRAHRCCWRRKDRPTVRASPYLVCGGSNALYQLRGRALGPLPSLLASAAFARVTGSMVVQSRSLSASLKAR